MRDEKTRSGDGRAYVRAVPWKTPTEDKVKGALGEIPAYVRRAKGLEATIDRLWREAEAARSELLAWVCLRAWQVEALPEAEAPEGGAFDSVRTAVEGLPAWRRLSARTPPKVRRGDGVRARDRLRDSIRRFNAAWETWLDEEAPLNEVNEQVEGYNRHWAFERQCVAKYVPLDKLGFRRREPLTREDLLDRYPLLPMP